MTDIKDLGFSTADFAVFVTMLVVSFGIGIYHAVVSPNSKEDYLMGSRQFGIVPIAISLCASFNSAYMILGIPGEVYSYGTQFLVMILGTGLGVVVSAELWLPILYKLNIVSIYEYFELRYNSKFPRVIMSIIFLLKTMLYVGIVVYAPAIALSSVTSLPWWGAVLLLGICATFYTTVGGLKAIVWTDVFQIFIMYGGILAIVIRGIIEVGGIQNVWQAAERTGRIEFFNPSVDPFVRHTFLNVLFGTFILWGSPYTCSQYLIHRALCLPTLTKGKMSLYLNYICQLTMVVLVALIGLILYAFYQDCDPVEAGVVPKRDAVVPLFVLQQFAERAPGLAGVFISCLFSGALSTLDSALHAMASVTWEEVKDFKRFKGITDQKEAMILRGMSVVFGVMATGVAMLCNDLGSLINTGGKLFGACMGPMFGFTLVSILVPCVNLKGSSFGLIGGQLINIWLSFGSVAYGVSYPPLEMSTRDCSMFNLTVNALPEDNSSTAKSMVPPPSPDSGFQFEDIYRMSYTVYPIIGMVLTIVLSIVGSLAFRAMDKNKIAHQTLKKDLVHPVAWYFLNSSESSENRKNSKAC